jgi:hypothetical protein
MFTAADDRSIAPSTTSSALNKELKAQIKRATTADKMILIIFERSDELSRIPTDILNTLHNILAPFGEGLMRTHDPDISAFTPTTRWPPRAITEKEQQQHNHHASACQRIPGRPVTRQRL